MTTRARLLDALEIKTGIPRKELEHRGRGLVKLDLVKAGARGVYAPDVDERDCAHTLLSLGSRYQRDAAKYVQLATDLRAVRIVRIERQEPGHAGPPAVTEVTDAFARRGAIYRTLRNVDMGDGWFRRDIEVIDDGIVEVKGLTDDARLLADDLVRATLGKALASLVRIASHRRDLLERTVVAVKLSQVVPAACLTLRTDDGASVSIFYAASADEIGVDDRDAPEPLSLGLAFEAELFGFLSDLVHDPTERLRRLDAKRRASKKRNTEIKSPSAQKKRRGASAPVGGSEGVCRPTDAGQADA